MALIIDGKTYRNLEDQVRYNKERIEAHYAVDRVLAEFGIRVVGQVDTAAELEGIVPEAFGDAYAVGTEAPYDFSIWTRTSSESTVAEGYWLAIGKLAIVGPQGPQGPQGEQGIQGEEGEQGVGVRDFEQEDYSIGTDITNNTILCTLTDGTESRFTVAVKNGPKGDQGEQGEQGPEGPEGAAGPAGKAIYIYGIYASVDLLPSPSLINDLAAAALVGTAEPYDMYVQVGRTPETAVWNFINFGTGTNVTVSNVIQTTWDADTKLDKSTGSRSYSEVYGVKTNGDNVMFRASELGSQGTTNIIAKYTDKGRLQTFNPSGDASTGYYEAVNYGYLNNNYAKIASLASVASNIPTIVYSSTEPDSPTTGMIWLKPSK